VLRALDVPVSSQVLVFSKTSLQRDLISPRTPRAIYFNDSVYVGWVPGGDIEVASIDPTLGAVFYLLPRRQRERPQFHRQTHACLQCHDSSAMTGGVPGLMVRSVFPDRSGQPILPAGTFVTNQQSPLAERWGGWYVTGTHGRQRHMGNVTARDAEDATTLDREAGANRSDLSRLIDTGPYLAPGSDIVALMVLEHQTQMHNVLTKAAYEVRFAMRDEAVMNEALGEPPSTRRDSTTRRTANATESVLRALLFSGEARLTDPISGSAAFVSAFAAPGPRDPRGRSLRELDLKRRLFRYPCSYLIHTEAFAALPAALEERLSARLGEVLTGKDQSPAFIHLSGADRAAIRGILVGTKVKLARSWRSESR